MERKLWLLGFTAIFLHRKKNIGFFGEIEGTTGTKYKIAQTNIENCL
jgi:hypothetical protein